MLATDIDRSRDIPHRHARVTLVDLAQIALAVLVVILGCGQPCRVVKNPFGPVAGLVNVGITGQRLRIFAVMGRQVAVAVHEHGKDHHRVRGGKGILKILDRHIQIKIVGRVKLRDS